MGFTPSDTRDPLEVLLGVRFAKRESTATDLFGSATLRSRPNPSLGLGGAGPRGPLAQHVQERLSGGGEVALTRPGDVDFTPRGWTNET